MTIEEIVNALKAEIKNQLGFPAFLLPQKAVNNTAHIDLLFQDMRDNGLVGEKLVLRAEYRTAGTHAKWLTETARLMRKLRAVESSHMLIPESNLRAYWTRISPGQWVYPSEDESSMPAEYVLPYRIEIDIPTRLLEE